MRRAVLAAVDPLAARRPAQLFRLVLRPTFGSARRPLPTRPVVLAAASLEAVRPLLAKTPSRSPLPRLRPASPFSVLCRQAKEARLARLVSPKPTCRRQLVSDIFALPGAAAEGPASPVLFQVSGPVRPLLVVRLAAP